MLSPLATPRRRRIGRWNIEVQRDQLLAARVFDFVFVAAFDEEQRVRFEWIFSPVDGRLAGPRHDKQPLIGAAVAIAMPPSDSPGGRTISAA